MAELSDRDGQSWHHLAGRIAVVLEPRLDRRVLANRSVTPGPGWGLEPVGASLRRARGLAASMSRSTPTLLRTDVAAFYASVTPLALAGALRGCGVDPVEAHLAADMLEGWGSEGYSGLPIGPPGSAILANAVLASVDAALGKFPYLRWVDDYLIGAGRRVRECLERLDEALDRVGLVRSAPKTVVDQKVAWLGRTSCTTRPC
jgi:hypothetical protein